MTKLTSSDRAGLSRGLGADLLFSHFTKDVSPNSLHFLSHFIFVCSRLILSPSVAGGVGRWGPEDRMWRVTELTRRHRSCVLLLSPATPETDQVTTTSLHLSPTTLTSSFAWTAPASPPSPTTALTRLYSLVTGKCFGIVQEKILIYKSKFYHFWWNVFKNIKWEWKKYMILIQYYISDDIEQSPLS